MSGSLEQFGLRMMSGEARGAGAAMLRGATRMIEPFYSTAMSLRNAMYDRGMLATQPLGRPTISIGNLTTGGTGKTPTVRWLAEQLRNRGRRPAVLMRGYRAAGATGSDEQAMLERYLNDEPAKESIPVQANPSRVAGAASVLRERPEIDTFILDDGFQHRRAGRDFDLLLISAANPFGYDHVFPRGLLRERLQGLRRAHAILLTRCELVTMDVLAGIEARLRAAGADVPIYRCEHALMPSIESMRGRRYFAFAGIGNPQGFERQLIDVVGAPVGSRWFADHHHYTRDDLRELQSAARDAGAQALVTTEKDWVKLQHVAAFDANGLPIVRAEMVIHFRGDAQEVLLRQIMAHLGSSEPATAASSPGAA